VLSKDEDNQDGGVSTSDHVLGHGKEEREK
jgi:hypothetical protein